MPRLCECAGCLALRKAVAATDDWERARMRAIVALMRGPVGVE